MRKVFYTEYGKEIIIAEEEWVRVKVLEIELGKTTKYEAQENDALYYIDAGMVTATINGGNFEFTIGKTILIKKGTMFKMIGVPQSGRVIVIERLI